MSDPLSICASAIAVATLAYGSCKALYEVICSIKDAPKTMTDLATDLATLQGVLESLKSNLQTQHVAVGLFNGQMSVVKELELPLKSCSDTCDEFKARLHKITSHSANGHTSFRDALKLHFFDKEVSAFKFRLGSYKSTLTIAMVLTSMKSTTDNKAAMQTLETQVQETRQILSGQIQGLSMGLQDVVNLGNQAADAVQRIEAQLTSLAQCLAVCMTAWSETSKVTGVTVKYIRALDDSKMLTGNIGNVGGGGPEVKIDVLIGQDRAKLATGNIEGNFALQFMNGPADTHRPRSEESRSLPPPPFLM